MGQQSNNMVLYSLFIREYL